MKKRNLNKRQFIKNYQREAVNYDKKRSQTLMGKFVDKIQLNFILKEIPQRGGVKVLEVGCGTGRILIPLAKRRIVCYGVDPSKNMLAVLKNKAKETGVERSILIKEGEMEKIPFSDDSFDVVYTMHVLMHMQRHEDAVKEMYRVLKPGGKMILDFPNKESLFTKLSLLLNPKKVRTGLYTKKYLHKLFKGYKYKIDGLFSYSKKIYSFPVLAKFFYFLEDNVKLPVSLRSQFLVVVKKI